MMMNMIIMNTMIIMLIIIQTSPRKNPLTLYFTNYIIYSLDGRSGRYSSDHRYRGLHSRRCGSLVQRLLLLGPREEVPRVSGLQDSGKYSSSR